MSDEKRRPWFWPTPEEQKANREYLEQFEQPGAAERWWLENGQMWRFIDTEERRKALKAGDVITDPALLCKGMRICIMSGTTKTGLKQEEAADFELARLDDEGFWRRPDGTLVVDPKWVAADGARFLGWANEGEGVKALEAVEEAMHIMHDEIREAAYAQAGIPIAEPQPTPTPRALPFKRHPECLRSHAEPVMCGVCEDLMASEMACKDDGTHTYADWYEAKDWRARQEPHSLAPSGMCGPILSKLR
jgi:hypothetical protein